MGQIDHPEIVRLLDTLNQCRNFTKCDNNYDKLIV
jgi:hypothetical protein